MQDKNRPDDHRSDVTPGEFDHLLREIEKEPVPERLLELAQRLQAALLHRRSRHQDGEKCPAEPVPVTASREGEDPAA